MNALVVGIGNRLLTDEALGPLAVDYLQEKQHREDATYIDAGNLSFTLLHYFDHADNLIMIDATNLQSEPGTVKCFVDEEIDTFLGKMKKSAHEVSLLDLMDILRMTDRLPSHRALIAVQPKSIEWGTCLSEEVVSSLDEINGLVDNLLVKWEEAGSSAQL